MFNLQLLHGLAAASSRSTTTPARSPLRLPDGAPFLRNACEPRRGGAARRDDGESSAKHRFSIWQRAEKRKERLLSSSAPPHISLHIHSAPVAFVPSSLSIDLNVTQPWHGFSRFARGKGFLYLPRVRDSIPLPLPLFPWPLSSPPPATPRSLLLLCFPPRLSLFRALRVRLTESARCKICFWRMVRVKKVCKKIDAREQKLRGVPRVARDRTIFWLFCALVISRLPCCATNWLINAPLQTAANRSI